MKQYYFNGGMYLKNGYNKEEEFGAVRPTNGLPYVTEDPKGIPCTSHHSSVYLLSEDFKTARLIWDNGTVPSPKEVELSWELRSELSQAIKELQAKTNTQEIEEIDR